MIIIGYDADKISRTLILSIQREIETEYGCRCLVLGFIDPPSDFRIWDLDNPPKLSTGEWEALTATVLNLKHDSAEAPKPVYKHSFRGYTQCQLRPRFPRTRGFLGKGFNRVQQSILQILQKVLGLRTSGDRSSSM